MCQGKQQSATSVGIENIAAGMNHAATNEVLHVQHCIKTVTPVSPSFGNFVPFSLFFSFLCFPMVENTLHVSKHPLVAVKLSQLRDSSASPKVFRELARDLAGMLAYEATEELAVSLDKTVPYHFTSFNHIVILILFLFFSVKALMSRTKQPS